MREKYRWSDSNRHVQRTTDFESVASTNSATSAFSASRFLLCPFSGDWQADKEAVEDKMEAPDRQESGIACSAIDEGQYPQGWRLDGWGGLLMKICNHLCEAHRLKVARLVMI